MGTPYMSEIKIMSFNFAPKGWAMCNGQFLPINQNQALFSLLGTMYGGNGQTTFALPNLQGQVPIHIGSEFNVEGEAAGESTHTVIQSEMPTHIHLGVASTVQAAQGSGSTPTNTKILGGARASFLYGPFQGLTAMDPREISNTGGSQPHDNMQPYLVLNFCIALLGVFPSRN
jgi:microcystin-dependent protein